MIQIEQVSKRYPAKGREQEVIALKEITLQIAQGEIFGIVGYSGAGKSTLLRLLNGLEKPTSGSIHVNGNDISSLSNGELRVLRQKIGMIFQHYHLLWSRTVRENVAFPLEIAGKAKHDIEQRTEELLRRVGLWERRDAYPSELSGGQKQRVGIARALANDPFLLLCDEATSALDPETTSSILQLVKEINQEMGITVVLITHEMSVVDAICNKVAVMETGSIVELGEVQQVFRDPQHEVTRRFTEGLGGGHIA
ncbi:D-methionine transport system ATP-binding protein [Thermoactinomyces sp. DSM 45892]|nr:D-methionine transport system ATP-binding protein [Thermoactinomyces sp. DSM 45892]